MLLLLPFSFPFPLALFSTELRTQGKLNMCPLLLSLLLSLAIVIVFVHSLRLALFEDLRQSLI